jgi:hypothetical protein
MFDVMLVCYPDSIIFLYIIFIKGGKNKKTVFLTPWGTQFPQGLKHLGFLAQKHGDYVSDYDSSDYVAEVVV